MPGTKNKNKTPFLVFADELFCATVLLQCFSPGCLISALAFTSLLPRAQRSGRSEGSGCSRAFSKGSNPGHACDPSCFLVHMGPFKAFITPCTFSQPLSSQAFWSIYRGLQLLPLVPGGCIWYIYV